MLFCSNMILYEMYQQHDVLLNEAFVKLHVILFHRKSVCRLRVRFLEAYVSKFWRDLSK